MAFRLPQQAPPRRQTSYSHPQRPPSLDLASAAEPDPTTEWVLFSPSQPSTTARTHTTSTERTRRTARLSDFGSFGTPARSAADQDGDEEVETDEPLDEDGTELDSLDDGLHAFRAPSLAQDSAQRWDHGEPAALPAHDGLGSFQASSELVQEQLWQHEQYNPRRRPELHRRRQSSVQRELDTIADDKPFDVERDRWQRIEKWRLDQSQALLQEIERETRRRRNSRVSQSTDRILTPSATLDSLNSVSNTLSERPSSSEATPDADEESFWRRITRKVIRDLIGIDDNLLSVLFGESLPLTAEDGEAQSSTAGSSKTVDKDEMNTRELDSVPEIPEELWQTKLLQRIARELGILVHQLCEHPGAFTTYLNLSNDISNEYAGIPVRHGADDSRSRLTALTTPAETTNDTSSSVMSPHFSPTLHDPNREHAAQWGIEDEDSLTRMARDNTADHMSESARLRREKEYWERELDVMMVFRYLRNRFSRRNSNTDSNYTSTRRHSQDASRRAAIIRQHHPLVARAHTHSQAQIRRQSQSGVSGPTGISSPLLRQHFRRPSSSCASQSAKLSAISSRRTLTSSSRNYWDIGGSVESGSAIAPVGAGLGGTWGDV